ncbi:MAG: aldolase [Dehalococcoidia bacterium]|nr:aldolase [Dehalococcoidia bacterium]
MFSQFEKVGRSLFEEGLVSSHGGNLSVRQGDALHITHRGSPLGSLGRVDVVETSVNRNTRSTPLCSSELPVHRAIYRKTSAHAIVHAHPSHAVALTFLEKELVPSDIEGRITLPRVPIIGQDYLSGPGELCEEIAEAFGDSRVVLVKGHGSFAIAELLEEAYYLTSILEQSCKVLCLLRSLR